MSNEVINISRIRLQIYFIHNFEVIQRRLLNKQQELTVLSLSTVESYLHKIQL